MTDHVHFGVTIIDGVSNALWVVYPTVQYWAKAELITEHLGDFL